MRLSPESLSSRKIGRLGTFVATLPMSGVKGLGVQAGEAWDWLSLWKYAIQAGSQEMTLGQPERPEGRGVFVEEGSRYGQADIEAAGVAASEVCAKGRRERAERDRRLEKLAIEVF